MKTVVAFEAEDVITDDRVLCLEAWGNFLLAGEDREGSIVGC